MKKYFFAACLFMLFAASPDLLAQNETPLVKTGKYEMSLSSVDGSPMEIAIVSIDISYIDKNTIAIYNAIHLPGSNVNIAIDTSITNANNFQPIYRSSFHKNFNLVLHYNKEITGYYLDKQTGKTTIINDKATGPFVDQIFCQYYIATLPLEPGYKKNINLYDYKPENKFNIEKLQVAEVKDNSYTSKLTGEHNVWQVKVTKDNNDDSYVYDIDKNTRRIWTIAFKTGGKYWSLADNEIDYNPYHTTFDKKSTLDLVNNGKSTIKGQAFARDHVHGADKIALTNTNKKQVAAKGTTVMLIPYTDFFKEWLSLVDAANKAHKQNPPLPKGAEECIKTTTVYDNNGHFEFTNLMPGDYMLLANMLYVHKYQWNQVTGYTDTYINGGYAGTTTNTATHSGATMMGDEAKKIVTIKTDGEKVEGVKLKSWK